MLKHFDPEGVAILTAKLAALFRLPLGRLTFLINTRTANPEFDRAVFDELFLRLSPKVSAFFQADDAMRQDDSVVGGHLIADDPANVWPMVRAVVDASSRGLGARGSRSSPV